VFLLNTLNQTISIDKIDVQGAKFEITKFKETALKYKELKNVFTITNGESLKQAGRGGYVILGTNIGSLVIPINIVSGELECFVESEPCDGLIDFGTI
jgi:hypothetical protein